MNKSKIKRSFILILGVVCILSGYFLVKYYSLGVFERRIVAATDQVLPETGKCDIDLSVLFSDYEWDTVSIFVAGNSKQIQADLGYDNDISDGILFTKDGENVIIAISTYDFLHDELPLVGYCFERNPDDSYYNTKLRDQAVVSVTKSMQFGKYKYRIEFKR